MKHRLLAFASALLLLAACDQQQEGAAAKKKQWQHALTGVEETDHTLACPDDFSEAEGFDAFLADLKQAVAEKDAEFILAMADDRIRYSFGAEGGKEGFVAAWKLDTPEESPFWEVMAEVLRIGGYASSLDGLETMVVFPCTFGELPLDSWVYMSDTLFSPYDYAVVVRAEAVLYDDAGNALRNLKPGEVLRRVGESQSRFSTHDGLTGNVHTVTVRSPLDYRAFFQRKDGEWTMPLFIAGD